MKKKCLIYANCQGEALGYWLKKSPCFNSAYEIEYVLNYKHIFEQNKIAEQPFKNADLFIYQPVDDKHGIYSTNYLMSLLKPRCLTISFPYIYNDGLWPIYKNGDKIVNEEPIANLIEMGDNLVQIIYKFLFKQINFNLKERFEKSLNQLKEREKKTDLKGVDYIENNFQHKKLFLTCNHPATNLILHYGNQIFLKLNFPTLPNLPTLHPNEAGLPGCYPSSPYEKKELKIEYCIDYDWKHLHEKKKRNNWKYIHLRHIFEIYSNQSHKKVGILSKWFRSLTKFI